MKKSNVKENLIALYPQVVVALAGRYDMPELIGLTPKHVERAEEGLELVLETKVTPRGQLASIVRELTVRLMAGSDNTGRHWFVLDLRYHHVDGGSNGKSTRFVAITETHYGEDEKFVDLISDRALYIVEHAQSERARTYLQTLSKEELFTQINRQ